MSTQNPGPEHRAGLFRNAVFCCLGVVTAGLMKLMGWGGDAAKFTLRLTLGKNLSKRPVSELGYFLARTYIYCHWFSFYIPYGRKAADAEHKLLIAMLVLDALEDQHSSDNRGIE
jgi:uncharacterized membrane protein YphA (DoxX/SURF4 family)